MLLLLLAVGGDRDRDLELDRDRERLCDVLLKEREGAPPGDSSKSTQGDGERLRDRLREEQREFTGEVFVFVEFGDPGSPPNSTPTSGVLLPVEVESVAAKASIVKGSGLMSTAEALLEPVPCRKWLLPFFFFFFFFSLSLFLFLPDLLLCFLLSESPISR